MTWPNDNLSKNEIRRLLTSIEQLLRDKPGGDGVSLACGWLTRTDSSIRALPEDDPDRSVLKAERRALIKRFFFA